MRHLLHRLLGGPTLREMEQEHKEQMARDERNVALALRDARRKSGQVNPKGTA